MISHRQRALALAVVASLAVAACGSSDKAADAVTPENVEMPAESALAPVDASPAADSAAAASSTVPTTTEGVAAAAGQAAADVAAAAAAAGADISPTPSPTAKKP